ncbi:MAG TPA: ChaN family lipoprotein [Nitrospirales bacterium]|nr:ChaN family lipoprotein [Nitrospirales bacterium]
MGRPFLLALFALAGSLFAGLAEPLPAEESAQPFQEWQILEVQASRPISFKDLLADLATADVIYIGEEHSHRSHIEAALRILQALVDRNRKPALGLEMFGWDGQAGLDHYLAEPDMATDQFLQKAHWKENWGGAYNDYAPLIDFARSHHLPVLALNPPKSLVRLVAKEGFLRALKDPEMLRWQMRDEVLSDEPAYREVMVSQLRACHSGLSEEAYQRMYEAAMFRDEGMAKIISERLIHRAADVGPVVSYTGAGHIQYRLPVPNRVLRRLNGAIRQRTVYLTSYEPRREDEIRTLLQQSIADYVWLTPLSAHGTPRRCL